MQIEISQSRQFKYSNVYVIKDVISCNCFTTIMQHFVVKKSFYFKTPDGAASISSPSYSPQCPSTNATGSTTLAGTGAIFAQISSIQESPYQNPALKKFCRSHRPGACRAPATQVSTHRVFTKGQWCSSRFHEPPESSTAHVRTC